MIFSKSICSSLMYSHVMYLHSEVSANDSSKQTTFSTLIKGCCFNLFLQSSLFYRTTVCLPLLTKGGLNKNLSLTSLDEINLTSLCCKERSQNKYHHKPPSKTFLNTFFLYIFILLLKQKRGNYPSISVTNTHIYNP